MVPGKFQHIAVVYSISAGIECLHRYDTTVKRKGLKRKIKWGIYLPQVWTENM